MMCGLLFFYTVGLAMKCGGGVRKNVVLITRNDFIFSSIFGGKIFGGKTISGLGQNTMVS